MMRLMQTIYILLLVKEKRRCPDCFVLRTKVFDVLITASLKKKES